MYKDLEVLGWGRVASVSQDLRQVILRTSNPTDDGNEHLLTVTIPDAYPFKQPSYDALLPVPLAIAVSFKKYLLLEFKNRFRLIYNLRLFTL